MTHHDKPHAINPTTITNAGGTSTSPHVGAPNITRVLLKLHYLLWTRSLKSNKSAMIMNIFIALYALIGLTVFGITMGVDLSAGRYASLAGAVGIGTAAYIMIAIMIPSGEGQLSPESFSALPLTVRQLMPSFFLVQVLQIRGFMAVLCTTVTAIIAAIAIAGSAGIIAVVVLVVAMVLSLLLVIVVAESLAMAMSGSANQSSSSKNKQIYVAFGAFIVAWLAYSSIFNGSDNSLDLVRYGNILQWTPLASAAGFAAFAAAGQWLSALICLLITVATIAAGGYVWWHFTHKRLVAPLGTGGVAGAGRRRKARAAGQQSLLLPGLPYTPLVAVYSRALRYLIRDARQTIMMVMPLVLLFYFAVMGFRDNPFMFYVLPIIIGLLSGTNAVNDYGFDGPSNWLHLSSGVAAKDVVRGRHWAAITPAILHPGFGPQFFPRHGALRHCRNGGGHHRMRHFAVPLGTEPLSHSKTRHQPVARPIGVLRQRLHFRICRHLFSVDSHAARNPWPYLWLQK